ncbi:mycofactocin biosynthesis glycosyltransferase MftF [Streptomyces sp. NBC_01373]|uniref:mycofactocin biosynthesis glycosyltransferase MftF n=1 Tax=Streptomyces sp. NBC_01373 TaxID=2903843 RepID=UPI00224F6169|nr:mycofactocin biosynthesis glycosyltransferase MftF [Streptomyces sp. NBC_01373]MCX4705402.1 mycofactocin biosynthesis glycosyltransferase MftF [Streptomyces sp. NBC_01373]
MTFPAGTVVELGPQVRQYDDGRVLVGGAPPRLVRLGPRTEPLLKNRRILLDGSPSVRLADRLVTLGMAHPVTAELPALDTALLTVVVPVRDRAPELDRLLAGIAGGGARVIVVDDGSHDQLAVRRVAARHSARLVSLDVNRGPAAARNAGLRQVRTPYVAFVDSDVVLAPDTLPTLLRHFHDPRLAVVAPRVLGLSDAGSGSWISRYEAARSSLDLGPDPALVHPRSRVSWVPSACLIARVDALGPGFAEPLRVGEDVDLVWRLAAEGRRIRYDPSVTVRHDHRTRLTNWLARKAYYGSGAHTLALRHGRAVAPAALTPWAAGVAAALLAQRRWSVPVAAAVLTTVGRRYTREATAGTVDPRRLAASLTGLGLAATAEQTAALLLRHWWPLSAAGCLVSRRVRRATLLAAVVDGLLEHRRCAPDLDPLRFTLARRLDDLAYGAGVWAGAVRGRSVRCLLPDIRGRGR